VKHMAAILNWTGVAPWPWYIACLFGLAHAFSLYSTYTIWKSEWYAAVGYPFCAAVGTGIFLYLPLFKCLGLTF